MSAASAIHAPGGKNIIIFMALKITGIL